METKTLLAQAIYQVLRPLVRTAMRHGLTAADVETLTRQAFVDTARAEYGIRGRPTNKSRVAALTGLGRAEVTRLLGSGQRPRGNELGERHILNRLITTWVNAPPWLDASGSPNPLPLSDAHSKASFPALVRAIGSDVTWQTLLRELERLGLASKTGDAVVLLKRAFVPASQDEADRIPYLGENIAAHADTVDYNLQHGATSPRFERKLVFPGLDAEGLRKLQRALETDGQAWLEQLNAELTPHSLDDTEYRQISGVGIYFFDMQQPDGGSDS